MSLLPTNGVERAAEVERAAGQRHRLYCAALDLRTPRRGRSGGEVEGRKARARLPVEPVERASEPHVTPREAHRVYGVVVRLRIPVRGTTRARVHRARGAAELAAQNPPAIRTADVECRSATLHRNGVGP